MFIFISSRHRYHPVSQSFCMFQMDIESNDATKKPLKRVLPQWMLEAGKLSKPEPEKKKEEKSVVYVMSPYELEEYAKQIVSMQED